MTLLERRDVLGGRAGTRTDDGFRFDTGPSWYFMPEVFEHFFALFGEEVSQHLDLVPLDPAYRVFYEPEQPGPSTDAEQLTIGRDSAANWRAIDRLEPGAGERVRRYVERSGEAYRLALDHFLYTTFERPDRLLGASTLRRLPRLARLLATSSTRRSAGRPPTRASSRSSATTRSSWGRPPTGSRPSTA
ncbi:hypothetical protein GCM10025865_08430 [Paraoerskovia sediminicola]|uniref:Amine oxidase domain-containing protein n=1 Tax=Paraoerskovia sediminicola TaxID=1138587 RepID=A0ABM8G0Q7_9CELL|nr:hypothetical protein GCM10025865_08430 [Paraoerskovia sediminicola]